MVINPLFDHILDVIGVSVFSDNLTTITFAVAPITVPFPPNPTPNANAHHMVPTGKKRRQRYGLFPERMVLPIKLITFVDLTKSCTQIVLYEVKIYEESLRFPWSGLAIPGHGQRFIREQSQSERNARAGQRGPGVPHHGHHVRRHSRRPEGHQGHPAGRFPALGRPGRLL